MGGGNCGPPSSPTPQLRPLQTHQRTHKNAGLWENPQATSQDFGLPDPSLGAYCKSKMEQSSAKYGTFPVGKIKKLTSCQDSDENLSGQVELCGS